MRLRSPMDFAVLVHQRRRELKLSQSELARRAGTSREWIVDLEKGKPRVPLSLVLRALRALQIAIVTAEDPGMRGTAAKQKRAGGSAADIDEILKKLRRKP